MNLILRTALCLLYVALFAVDASVSGSVGHLQSAGLYHRSCSMCSFVLSGAHTNTVQLLVWFCGHAMLGNTVTVFVLGCVRSGLRFVLHLRLSLPKLLASLPSGWVAATFCAGKLLWPAPFWKRLARLHFSFLLTASVLQCSFTHTLQAIAGRFGSPGVAVQHHKHH